MSKLLLLAAAAVGALSVWLRQPLILAYIFVGILVGPAMLGWVTARDQVDLLARLGIAVLLFVVGLKLDLHLIRTLGPVAPAADVILFGLGRYGHHVARHLRERGLNVLGVDFNSATVSDWQRQGLCGLYGHAEDPYYPGTPPLNQAQWIVSTIAQLDITLALLDALHHYGYSGRKAVTAHSSSDAEILKESGADLILSPFADATKEQRI